MAVVGLDLRALEPGFKAHAGRGTGRYVSALSEALGCLAPSGVATLPSLSSASLLGDAQAQGGLCLKPVRSSDLALPGWQERLLSVLPAGRQTVRNQLFVGQRTSSLGIDLMHYFAHGDAPAVGGPASVVTVLDLIPLRFPELYRATKTTLRFRFARYLEDLAVRRASGIIAISEHTKRDVCEFLGVDPSKIVVTPLAVDHRFSPLASGEEQLGLKSRLLAEWGFEESAPFLLYVGGIDPRKNVGFLLRVLAELVNEWPEAVKPVFVLAGGIERDDHYPELLGQISALGLLSRVKLLGFVDDDALVELYRAADLFVFPSLYEGFGFPVLEAMSCGCAVIAGDNSSLPEVVGDMPVLVTDNSMEHWKQKIFQLLRSPSLREHLVEMGLERSKSFSWKRTAQLTMEAYQRFLRNLEQGHQHCSARNGLVKNGLAKNTISSSE